MNVSKVARVIREAAYHRAEGRQETPRRYRRNGQAAKDITVK